MKCPPPVVKYASALAHYLGRGLNKVNATRYSMATRRRRSPPDLEVSPKNVVMVYIANQEDSVPNGVIVVQENGTE